MCALQVKSHIFMLLCFFKWQCKHANQQQNAQLMSKNKAGYAAISCGRVGRGGNARFPTFRLDGYGRTDQRTDGRTDKASYRVACPQLKRKA